MFGGFSALIGSSMSFFIRIQLQQPPGNTFLINNDFQMYNVIVTLHGLIMIFMYIMPVLIGGFGNYLLPILVGAPEMAFPRLNNLSFLMLPLSLFLMGLSFCSGEGAGVG